MSYIVAIPLEVDGNQLNAGAVVPESPRAVLLLLHGIPSSAPPDPNDEGYPGLAQEFADNDYLAGWVDMRAAKNSAGFFSIEGWVRDATAALEAVRALDSADGLPAVIIGSSAGGAVASVAVNRGADADAIALLAAPANWVSFSDDARAGVERIQLGAGMAIAPEVVGDPEEWAAEFQRVRTEDAVAGIDIPLLVVHGAADAVVPAAHATTIAANAPNAELCLLDGAGHQLRRDPRAIESLLEWLDRTV